MMNCAVTKNINMNLKSKYGESGFMFACALGHLEIVKTLLDNPIVQVDAKDNSGLTALMNACVSGKVHVVKLLLNHPRTMNVNLNEIKWISDHLYPMYVDACVKVETSIVGDEIVTLLKKQEEYLCAKKSHKALSKKRLLDF